MEELRPSCEQAIGRSLLIKYDPSASIKRSIEAGEAFDVTIVATDLMDALIQQGAIAPVSRTDIARASVGVGVRAGAPRPDVATPEAMKKALLAAKGIAYTKDGASVPFVAGMLDRLGIAEQVRPKTFLAPSTTDAAAHVVDGSADLIFTMISEILPIQGLQLAGPLPETFPRYLTFSAGTSVKSANAEAAGNLIKFLTTPDVVPILKSKGMEPVKK